MKNLFRKELKDLPVYVPGKPMEDVIREFGLTKVVKLASNENPLGPSPKAVDAVQAEAGNINIYPDPAVRALREKLAEIHQVAYDEIMVGSGGEALLALISQAVIGEGDEIIVAEPSFSLYEIGCKMMGGVARNIPVLKDSLDYDFEGMLAAINDRTKIVYVCNPNNPTGTIVSKEALDAFVARLPEDILLVLDEAYYEFAAVNEEYPNGLDILRRRRNTIVLRTFAKVSGIAGLRCGYIFSNSAILKEISKCSGVFAVNRLAQVAALAALEDQEHIDRSVALNQASLQAMMDFFDERGLFYVKPGGNFIWVDVQQDTRELYVELQKRGVIVRPGFLWGWDNWLRISSGTMEATEILLEALEQTL